MSSVVSAPVRKNDTPLMKGRQPRKFTLENIARIKDWVAQGSAGTTSLTGLR